MPSPDRQTPRSSSGIRSLIYLQTDMDQVADVESPAQDQITNRQPGAASGGVSQERDKSQGLPSAGLPGLWRRAAPQVSSIFQGSRADLSASYSPVRGQHDPYAFPPEHSERLQSQKSLREQYALPGQVQKSKGECYT